MIVTETLRAPGSWTLQLRRATPRSVVAALRASTGVVNTSTGTLTPTLNGWVVVFPTRPEVASASLSAAIYTGRLFDWDGELGFAGEGLPAELNTSTGEGAVNTGASVAYTARDLSSWLDVMLPANGITKGAVTLSGLSPVAHDWLTGVGVRHLLDEICDKVGGADWRIRPTGVLDAGPPAALFRSGEVFVSSAGASQSGQPRGLVGEVVGQSVSGRQVADRVLVAGGDVGPGMLRGVWLAGSERRVSLDGTRAEVCAVVDSPGSSQAECDAAAAAVGALRATLRSSFDVRVVGEGIRSDVAPGDVVWLLADLVGLEQGLPAVIDGHTRYVLPVRVTSMEWSPVPEKWSVMLLTRSVAGSPVWTDLSPWVEWPTSGAASLTVSHGRGAVEWAAQQGVRERLGTVRPTLRTSR